MQAYLHAAFVPLENVDVGGVAASSGSIITQLHPNVYTATKTLPYYETNGSIQNADTLHFVFEKVTFENVFSMYDYVNSQNNALDRGDVSVPVAVQLIAKQATEPVTHSLNLLFFSSQDVLDEFDAGTEENPTAQLTSWRSDFTYCFESRDSGTMTSLNSVLASSVYDVWIAYCTRQDPSVTWPIDYNTQAEMVLTLLADNTSPFDTHIGMSRNCNIFYTATKPHPNLSVQISSFAMAASAQAYGAAKNYMLTRAVPSNASVVNAYFVSKGLNSSISYPADMQASTDQSDPDSLYATYPLNNLDTNNWLILPRGETVPVSFTRPRWFPFQTKTANEQHFHLTNIFDQMLAVDAAAFISYWNAAY